MSRNIFPTLVRVNVIVATILLAMDLPAVIDLWNGMFWSSRAAQQITSIGRTIAYGRAPCIIAALAVGIVSLRRQKHLRLVCGLQGLLFAVALLVTALVYLNLRENELVLPRSTFLVQTAIFALYPAFLIVFSAVRKDRKG